MYLQDLWASGVRRWPLVIAVLVVAAGLLLGASFVVKPTYEAGASMVLVPPVNPAEPTENRYLGLGGLKQSADVLARSMTSVETTKAIESLAPPSVAPAGTYQVDPDVASSAPILAVTATSATSAGAERMLAATLDQLPLKLELLQESVDIKAPNQITRVMVSRDAEPEAVQKARLRILGFLAACLLMLGALVVGIVDGILLRRSGVVATQPRRPGIQDPAGPLGGEPPATGVPATVPATATPPRPHEVAPADRPLRVPPGPPPGSPPSRSTGSPAPRPSRVGPPPPVPTIPSPRNGNRKDASRGGEPSSNGHEPDRPTSS